MKTKLKLTFAGALVAAALLLAGCGEASGQGRGGPRFVQNSFYSGPNWAQVGPSWYGRGGFWDGRGRGGFFSRFRGTFGRGSFGRFGGRGRW